MDVTEEFAGLYAFFAKETDGWVLYLVTEDGDIRSFSRDVTEEDAKFFADYVSGPGVVTQGPITVTLHTTADDAGDTVTIRQASGSGNPVAIDVLERYYVVVGRQQLVDPVTGKTHVLQGFDPPQAWADLAGSIRAEATAGSIGLDVKTGAGMIGVQAIANQGANVRVSVIGDVRLQGSDRDGLYVKLAAAVPRLGYIPQGEIYLRGSVTVTNARDEASGVSAIGGVVTVKTQQTGLLILDADGNPLPTEQTEDGFRFTVPEGCGVSITTP